MAFYNQYTRHNWKIVDWSVKNQIKRPVGPDQDIQNVGPHLDPNRLTMQVKKVNFEEKNSRVKS